MLNLRFSLPALAAAAVFGLAAPANATVFIGLQQDAGAIVTVASGASNQTQVFAGSFGNFESNVVTGFGQPGNPAPQVLSATVLASNNDGAADAGTLTIYVVSTGNTQASISEFTSGLTTVLLPKGWTETLQTYLDPTNGGGPDGIYALGTPLGSASFTTTGSDTDITVADTGSGSFYSVTAVFTIRAPTFGTTTADAGIVDAVVVPEPASLALLGGALLGFGIFARRRKGV